VKRRGRHQRKVKKTHGPSNMIEDRILSVAQSSYSALGIPLMTFGMCDLSRSPDPQAHTAVEAVEALPEAAALHLHAFEEVKLPLNHLKLRC